MKIILTLFLLIACTTGMAQGNEIKEKIKTLQLQYDKAVEQKDTLMLDRLFHPDMMITGGDGSRRNKAAEIKDCADPRYNVVYFTTKNIEIDVFSATAILRGDLEWQLKSGENLTTINRRITYTYAKMNDKWQIVSQHIGMPPRKAN
jgi:ketosteroid isomerase-like protein